MAQKTKIQYVRQFYVYGSEAQQAAPAPKKPQRKKLRPARSESKVIYIDPLALGGLAVAAVMLVLLVLGSFQLRDARAEFERAFWKASDLELVNKGLQDTYQSKYDLEQVRQDALKIGMIDAEEAEGFTVVFTVPTRQKAPTAWEDFLWLLSGLLDNPKRS